MYGYSSTIYFCKYVLIYKNIFFLDEQWAWVQEKDRPITLVNNPVLSYNNELAGRSLMFTVFLWLRFWSKNKKLNETL